MVVIQSQLVVQLGDQEGGRIPQPVRRRGMNPAPTAPLPEHRSEASTESAVAPPVHLMITEQQVQHGAGSGLD
ncbi:MAG: hypothetical protein WAK86_13020 [Pseudonocardiaceae bacterium]